MSNQNRKSKVRARMAATGSKYTEAGRELDAREGLVVAVPGSPLLRTARTACDECGGPIRWVQVSELQRLRPEEHAVLAAFYDPQGLNDSAWVCLQCDNFGVFGTEHFEGDWSESANDDCCPECGGDLEWVDPASVAARDRQAYMLAKRTHGASALLDGEASVCSACSRIEFHPWMA